MSDREAEKELLFQELFKMVPERLHNPLVKLMDIYEQTSDIERFFNNIHAFLYDLSFEGLLKHDKIKTHADFFYWLREQKTKMSDREPVFSDFVDQIFPIGRHEHQLITSMLEAFEEDHDIDKFWTNLTSYVQLCFDLKRDTGKFKSMKTFNKWLAITKKDFIRAKPIEKKTSPTPKENFYQQIVDTTLKHMENRQAHNIKLFAMLISALSVNDAFTQDERIQYIKKACATVFVTETAEWIRIRGTIFLNFTKLKFNKDAQLYFTKYFLRHYIHHYKTIDPMYESTVSLFYDEFSELTRLYEELKEK